MTLRVLRMVGLAAAVVASGNQIGDCIRDTRGTGCHVSATRYSATGTVIYAGINNSHGNPDQLEEAFDMGHCQYGDQNPSADQPWNANPCTGGAVPETGCWPGYWDRDVMPFSGGHLRPSGNAQQRWCMTHQPVLEPFPHLIQTAINHAISGRKLCAMQKSFCDSIHEYRDVTEGCDQAFGHCRAAFRHLKRMMFVAEDGSEGPQVCNNFALKSVRGFFHDYMSSFIDGSILHENNISMNVGLCRWTQYVAVLSDETRCDPGSIVAMAGQLGFEACGVPLQELDDSFIPQVKVGRGYTCRMNRNPKLADATGEKFEMFSDMQTSANSTAMEEFWYALNEHSHPRPNGEMEYAASATMSAHAIGRVTCPVEGVDNEGREPDIHAGFFHEFRNASGRPMQLNADIRFDFYKEAADRLHDTACTQSCHRNTSSGSPPNFMKDCNTTDGVRVSTEEWPVRDSEAQLNSIGGFCGMPTQFQGTIRTGHGGDYRTARFMDITQWNALDGARPARTEHQTACGGAMNFRMHWEQLNFTNNPDYPALPSNPALTRFENIAWHGIGTTTSEWDSCAVECNIPVMDNRLCGGGGLRDFDWTMTDAPTASTQPTTASPSGAPSCTVRAAGPLILDVRQTQHFGVSSLGCAVNVPRSQVASSIPQILSWVGGDHSYPIQTLCYRGNLAEVVRVELVNLGFSNVINAGGYNISTRRGLQALCSASSVPACAGEPTDSPTLEPTLAQITSQPTASPATSEPTSTPIRSPATSEPSSAPATTAPTRPGETMAPTASPVTPAPTVVPTHMPTASPATSSPTLAPTSAPTYAPATLTSGQTSSPVSTPTIVGGGGGEDGQPGADRAASSSSDGDSSISALISGVAGAIVLLAVCAAAVAMKRRSREDPKRSTPSVANPVYGKSSVRQDAGSCGDAHDGFAIQKIHGSVKRELVV